MASTARAEHWLEGMLGAIPDDPGGLARACGVVTDWGVLLEGAERHGLTGILHRALSELRSGPPSDVAIELRRRAGLQRLLQRRLAAALDEARRAFEDAGVVAVPLKGPVLGERLYGDSALRVATDLDLLVAPAQFPAAASVLARLGYQTEAVPEELHGTGRIGHHIAFYSPEGLSLELHFRLLSHFGREIPASAFLERAGAYRSATGRAWRVLAPDDELIYLLAHAAGHLFSRLAWLFDVKMFLRGAAGLEPSAVADRAARLGLATVYRFALEAVSRRLNLLDPSGERASPDRLRHAAAGSLLWAARTARSDTAPGKVMNHLFRASLCDGPAGPVRYLAQQGLDATARWRRQRRRGNRKNPQDPHPR